MSKGKKYLIITQDDLSRQAEVRALSTLDLKVVIKFLQEDVIYRYGYFRKLIINSSPKNDGLVTELVEKYFERVVILAYYLQANRIVEHGHQLIIDVLVKITNSSKGLQTKNLAIVLQANQVTVQVSTRMSPYYVLYRSKAILPIKLKVLIWHVLPQQHISTTK